jgi:hypothetical protein
MLASSSAPQTQTALWAQYRHTHPELLVRELALLGYESEARELIARLSQQPGVDPFWVFMAYYVLGHYDEALVRLRRVIDGWHLFVLSLRLPNKLPGLQEQPGYAELLEYLDSIQRSR